MASQPPASATDHNFSSPRYRAKFAGKSDIRTTDARADRWPPLARQADAPLPFLFQVRRDAGSRAGRTHERVQKVRRLGGRRRPTSRAGDGDRIARAGSKTTTTMTTATATATTRTTALTATNETTHGDTRRGRRPRAMDPSLARDGPHRRRRRRRCRWKRRRLPCSMMISLAAMSAEAARRPAGVRQPHHTSCESEVFAAPSETSSTCPLARSTARQGSTSNQSKYCITTTPPSPHVTRAGQRLITFT